MVQVFVRILVSYIHVKWSWCLKLILISDECMPNNGNGPCQHYCENLQGSFECSCMFGYELSDDLMACHVCTLIWIFLNFMKSFLSFSKLD